MRALLVLLALSLSACTNLSPQLRWQHADRLASDAGWHSVPLDTKAFAMTAYVPDKLEQAETLNVYIEGDGLAWLSRTQPSADPTPLNPVGLQLALQHAVGGAVYLARPCQYTQSDAPRNCDARYWTTHRFSPEVIDAVNDSIALLSARYRAKKLVLIGYSGGGAVALLVAARRTDVARVITVAGNLDHAAWTALHRVSPLSGSLNPADETQALSLIPQIHFVGGRDRNVPADIAASYTSKLESSRRPQIIVLPDFDHTCCWAEEWGSLRQRYLQ